MKKNIIRSCLVFCVVLLTSCKHFSDYGSLKKDLENKAEIAASEDVPLTIKLARSEYGVLSLEGDYVFKKLEPVVVSFKINPNYSFERWVVVDADNNDITDEVVTIETTNEGFEYTAKIIFKNVVKGMQLIPSCHSLLDKTPPEFSNMVVACGTKVLSNKNYELWNDDDFVTNHITSLNFKFDFFEEDSDFSSAGEKVSIKVKEKLVKNVNGDNADIINTTVLKFGEDIDAYNPLNDRAAFVDIPDNMYVNKANGNYSVNINYSFATVQDGIVLLEFTPYDTNNNKGETISYYVVKDTKISCWVPSEDYEEYDNFPTRLWHFKDGDYYECQTDDWINIYKFESILSSDPKESSENSSPLVNDKGDGGYANKDIFEKVISRQYLYGPECFYDLWYYDSVNDKPYFDKVEIEYSINDSKKITLKNDPEYPRRFFQETRLIRTKDIKFFDFKDYSETIDFIRISFKDKSNNYEFIDWVNHKSRNPIGIIRAGTQDNVINDLCSPENCGSYCVYDFISSLVLDYDAHGDDRGYIYYFEKRGDSFSTLKRCLQENVRSEPFYPNIDESLGCIKYYCDKNGKKLTNEELLSNYYKHNPSDVDFHLVPKQQPEINSFDLPDSYVIYALDKYIVSSHPDGEGEVIYNYDYCTPSISLEAFTPSSDEFVVFECDEFSTPIQMEFFVDNSSDEPYCIRYYAPKIKGFLCLYYVYDNVKYFGDIGTDSIIFRSDNLLSLIDNAHKLWIYGIKGIETDSGNLKENLYYEYINGKYYQVKERMALAPDYYDLESVAAEVLGEEVYKEYTSKGPRKVTYTSLNPEKYINDGFHQNYQHFTFASDSPFNYPDGKLKVYYTTHLKKGKSIDEIQSLKYLECKVSKEYIANESLTLDNQAYYDAYIDGCNYFRSVRFDYSTLQDKQYLIYFELKDKYHTSYYEWKLDNRPLKSELTVNNYKLYYDESVWANVCEYIKNNPDFPYYDNDMYTYLESYTVIDSNNQRTDFKCLNYYYDTNSALLHTFPDLEIKYANPLYFIEDSDGNVVSSRVYMISADPQNVRNYTIWCDQPVLMEFITNDKYISDSDWLDWERHTPNQNKKWKEIKPATLGTGTQILYTSPEVPAGKYGVVIAHFANGKTLMSKVIEGK